jgi:predicted permease
MRVMKKLRLRLRSLLRGRQVDEELHEEFRYHLERLIESHVAAGMPRDEARYAARREMGPIEQLKEQCRDARGFTLLDSLRQDVVYALRVLLKSPGFTVVALLSFAFGIGANVAVFSLVNGLLLRSLPVTESERLAVVTDSRAVQGFTGVWTYAIWDQIRQRAQLFDGACAWWTERLNFAPSGGEVEPGEVLWVSGEYFTTLGVPALLGRPLRPEDDLRGGSGLGPVAVISHDLWQRRFGGVANVIGTSLGIERVPFTIVGVTPPDFFGAEVGRTFDVALPMNAEALIRGPESRMNPERPHAYAALTVLVRLKPTQSVDAATTSLRGVQPQIREAAAPPGLPEIVRKQFLKDPFTFVPAATGTSRLRVRYERPLMVILVVVALILFIACANIANLQLTRALARRHELSVRVALGASHWRVARQWFVESLLLSTAGAGLGLLFASWGSGLLVGQLSTVLNRVYLDVSLDWRVLTFAAVMTVAATLLFGTLPALRAAYVAPIEALSEPARGSWTNGRGGRGGVSKGLMIAQMALSLVIVVAAGLFLRSFQNLSKLPLGFDSNRLLLVNVNIARARAAPDDRVLLFDRLVNQIRVVPGVAQAAASINTPVTGVGIVDVVHLPALGTSIQPMLGPRLGPQHTFVNSVTPGWFATYGTPIRAGRDFDEGDIKGGLSVIIVNEEFVRKFLPERDPIGASVEFVRGRGGPVAKTIVGLVSNAVYGSLRNSGAPTLTAYAPLAQIDLPPGPPPTDLTISVRAAAGPPMQLARGIAAALTAFHPDLEFGFRPMTDQVSANVVQERIVAMLSAFFGTLALLLAAFGLYGMSSYAVRRRRTELGIRMALGATASRVIRLVVSRAVCLVGAGILVGATLSVWASKFVATLLFGLEPQDPVTVIGAAVTLAAVATFASWLPAWRASRIEPARVLREGCGVRS